MVKHFTNALQTVLLASLHKNVNFYIAFVEGWYTLSTSRTPSGIYHGRWYLENHCSKDIPHPKCCQGRSIGAYLAVRWSADWSVLLFTASCSANCSCVGLFFWGGGLSKIFTGPCHPLLCVLVGHDLFSLKYMTMYIYVYMYMGCSQKRWSKLCHDGLKVNFLQMIPK